MGRNDAHRLNEELTNAWTIILGGVFVLGGVLLLWYSSTGPENAQLAAVAGQVGGLLVATGLLTVTWDLVGRRTFAREVFSLAKLSDAVRQSGLVAVPARFYEDIDWEDLFKQSTEADVVVAYARTWRNAHHERLRALARRGRLRVYLPDPDDETTVRVLAQRFDREDPEDTAADIRTAIREFSGLGGNVEVYVRAGDAVFTCYHFGGKAVLTLYSHGRARRTSVPSFVMEGGALSRFVDQELEAIREQSRRVFPAAVPAGGEH